MTVGAIVNSPTGIQPTISQQTSVGQFFFGLVWFLNHNMEVVLRKSWFQMMLVPDSSI